MPVVLELEAIGDHNVARDREMQRMYREARLPFDVRAALRMTAGPRAWVRRLLRAQNGGGLVAEQIHGHRDYSRANSVGSRGIYQTYVLHDGEFYEVSEPVSWRQTDHYFCTVESGQVVKMSEEEARQWLLDRDHE